MAGIIPSGVIAASGAGGDIFEANLFAQLYFSVGYANYLAAYPGVTINPSNVPSYGTMSDIWAWDGTPICTLQWTTNRLELTVQGQGWNAGAVKKIRITRLSNGHVSEADTFTVENAASIYTPGITRFYGTPFDSGSLPLNENYKVEIFRDPDNIHYQQMMTRPRPLVFSNHLCVAGSTTVLYQKTPLVGSMTPNIQAGAEILRTASAGSINWQWERVGFAPGQEASMTMIEVIHGNVGNGYQAGPGFILPTCSGPSVSSGGQFRLLYKNAAFTWAAGATITVRMWRSS